MQEKSVWKSCIKIGNKLNFNLVTFNCHTHHIMSSVNRQICTVHITRTRANHIQRRGLIDNVETITVWLQNGNFIMKCAEKDLWFLNKISLVKYKM